LSSTEQKTGKKRRSPGLPRRILKDRRSRPKFVRQESWRYKRLRATWRRPRGVDSRMRLKYSGSPPIAKIGYRGRRKYRGLHPSGLREVLVHNPKDLGALEPGTQAARIAGSVGKRKRMLISEAADERGITLLNPPVHREALETAKEEEEAKEEKEAEAAEQAEEEK